MIEIRITEHPGYLGGGVVGKKQQMPGTRDPGCDQVSVGGRTGFFPEQA